jgi:hypothetical protein
MLAVAGGLPAAAKRRVKFALDAGLELRPGGQGRMGLYRVVVRMMAAIKRSRPGGCPLGTMPTGRPA